jgi:hypothetical protein
MSIESDIKRIADGVEKILAIMSNVTVATTSAKIDGASFTPEVEKVEVVKVEALKVEEVKAVEPTEEEIRVVIREFMQLNGKEKAIALLVKYGAKADKPMIKDVTNKTALMNELKG